MARWEPNAASRLLEAAMELFRDPGYDQVTVAEIAARAGLTPRTFFRHFTDKREVLFASTAMLEQKLGEIVRGVPEGTSAIEAVGTALAFIARINDGDPEHAAFARQRHVVIQAHAELRERDMGKAAALSAALSSALLARGVADPAARLAADAGLAAFKVGFERWIDDPRHRTMGHHVRDAMGALRAVCEGSVVVGGPGCANRADGEPG